MDATDATNAATSASACGPPACTSLHRINTTCMLAPLDKHILAVIQSNARLSHTELASHVDSTPTSCRNRLQHLERAGYILDYTALLDPVKLGMPLLMFIEITLDRTHPEAFGRLPKVLSEVPEVLECHRVTGKFDFLVKMRAKDVSACTAFLSSMLHACPGIRRTYTRMVVEEIVCMPGVPLA
ncbi:Lrp/AsnC family transcriptional regulator [Noviherbaspirillum sp. CPCC 100848]|uniref:Lrp/AsnC family transcriptional regulator n=1 Tax=Noviherbaspirillum album TaxID=3080276 RepID=A0ABU6J5P8_9BURK|nr:Lrp/AsnC family transcriptional regulator [Noviherbaspirillum sp. CPCC 100848]MEC4718958.1 Lrp/AsnC family transcriptional regulator [Noviherbaspirillum sp. CPCC 100848]